MNGNQNISELITEKTKAIKWELSSFWFCYQYIYMWVLPCYLFFFFSGRDDITCPIQKLTYHLFYRDLQHGFFCGFTKLSSSFLCFSTLLHLLFVYQYVNTLRFISLNFCDHIIHLLSSYTFVFIFNILCL